MCAKSTCLGDHFWVMHLSAMRRCRTASKRTRLAVRNSQIRGASRGSNRVSYLVCTTYWPWMRCRYSAPSCIQCVGQSSFSREAMMQPGFRCSTSTRSARAGTFSGHAQMPVSAAPVSRWLYLCNSHHLEGCRVSSGSWWHAMPSVLNHSDAQVVPERGRDTMRKSRGDMAPTPGAPRTALRPAQRSRPGVGCPDPVGTAWRGYWGPQRGCPGGSGGTPGVPSGGSRAPIGSRPSYPRRIWPRSPQWGSPPCPTRSLGYAPVCGLAIPCRTRQHRLCITPRGTVRFLDHRHSSVHLEVLVDDLQGCAIIHHALTTQFDNQIPEAIHTAFDTLYPDLRSDIDEEWRRCWHTAALPTLPYEEHEADLFWDHLGLAVHDARRTLSDEIYTLHQERLTFYQYGRSGATIAPHEWMGPAPGNQFGSFHGPLDYHNFQEFQFEFPRIQQILAIGRASCRERV